MPPPDQADLARRLRSALGADRVAYWRGDERGVALPWASDPPDWLRVVFAPDQGDDGPRFARGPDGVDLLPLSVRAGVTPEAGVLSLRVGADGGAFAVWDKAEDAPPHLFEVAEFALGMLAQQLATPSRETLAEAERRFTSVAEALPQGIVILPADSPHRGYVNFAAARLLGLAPGAADAACLARALSDFAQRARNADEVRSHIAPLFRDAGAAPSPCIWRFDSDPTALRVTQAPMGPLGGAGWVWLIDDVSVAERAQELQRLHLTALEAADNAMMIANAEGRIEWANPAFCAMSGYRMDEVIGRKPGEIVGTRENPPELYQDLWQTISSGRVWSREMLNRRKDGSLYPEHQVITPFHVDGEIRHYVAVKNDITRQKETEHSLRQALDTLQNYRNHLETLVAERTASAQAAEARLRLILDSSADGLIGTDAQGTITFANPAALAMLGYRLEDLVGRNAHSTIHVPPRGSRVEGHTCPLFESIRKGIQVRVESETFWRADGSQVPVRIATHPMVDQGRTVGGVISFADISERLRADAALRESEARFRHMADAAPVMIWMSGLDKQCHYFNRGWLEFTGRSLEQESGNGWAEGVHPEDLERCVDIYQAHFDARQAFSMAYRLRHRDGSHRWILDNGVPRFDEQGAFLGYIGACIDIDDIKQAQAARERAHQEAERLAQAKSDFLANMSHEIRTPLNGVLGLAQIGHRLSAGNDKLTQTFGNILDSGKLLLTIINDILDLSKIDAGRMEVESVPCAPRRIVEETLSLVRKRATDKGLELVTRLAPDLPEQMLGDPVRIAQVLLNLLTNGIKFTPEGGVTLEVGHAAGQLTVVVSDTGIGMPAEVLERIFQPFQQADTSTTRKYGGTGLGLSISHRLVQLMGGDIRVDSRVDRGSRFEVRLPCPPCPAPLPVSAAVPSGGQRLQGLRLLVAEDNPVNQLVLADMLEMEGARFRVVDNGALAVAAVEQDPGGYDLVLMDVQMPVMDGRAATRRIRALAPDLPVLGQTAHALAEDRRLCLEAGMVDTLTKPLTQERLVATVRRHVPAPPQPAPTPAVTAPETAPGSGRAATLIDWSAFTQRFARHPEMILRLCRRTLESYAGTAGEIRAVAARRDLDQVRQIAHGIKGMAGYFDAGALHAAALEAERAAREGLAEAPERAEALAAMLDRFIEEVTQGMR